MGYGEAFIIEAFPDGSGSPMPDLYFRGDPDATARLRAGLAACACELEKSALSLEESGKAPLFDPKVIGHLIVNLMSPHESSVPGRYREDFARLFHEARAERFRVASALCMSETMYEQVKMVDRHGMNAHIQLNGALYPVLRSGAREPEKTTEAAAHFLRTRLGRVASASVDIYEITHDKAGVPDLRSPSRTHLQFVSSDADGAEPLVTVLDAGYIDASGYASDALRQNLAPDIIRLRR